MAMLFLDLDRFNLILILTYVGVFVVLAFASLADFFRGRAAKRRDEQARIAFGSEIKKYLEGKISLREHATFIHKRINDIHWMRGFDLALSELDEARRKRYTNDLSLYVQSFSKKISKGGKMLRAYWVSILFSFTFDPEREYAGLYAMLKPMLTSRAVYIRDNAFRLICKISKVEKILKAVDILVKDGKPIQPKLVLQSLESYPLNPEELIAGLLAKYHELTTTFKVAVLTYARFHSGKFVETVYAYAQVETDKEAMFNLLRYFTKYPYPRICLLMQNLLKEELASGDFLYAPVIASALRNYVEFSETLPLLDCCVTSKDYKTRENAASSLYAVLGKDSIAHVDALGDRFGSDIIRFIASEHEREDD